MNILIISDNENLCTFVVKLLIKMNQSVVLKFTDQNKKNKNIAGYSWDLIDLQDSFTIKNIIQKFDIVFSIHCQKIFPTILVEEIKCINLHPGYNPENKGWYPQVFSILNGKKFGATLHEMDSEIDGGPIIAQEQINIEFKDTSYTAYQKVLKLEKQIFKKNISKILAGNYHTDNPDSGNYNSKSDFKKLQNLNLNAIGTLGSHINILRALTFPGFNNAIVETGGKSYVIKIDIEEIELN